MKKPKVLIITDIQNDFIPSGPLGVPGARAIIPVINRMISKFEHVVATQDWHPSKHISFAKVHGKDVGEVIQAGNYEQVLWPVHCVQQTKGADFAEELDQDLIEAIFHKGVDPKIDSYSTFFDNARKRSTGLSDHLHEKNYKDLYFVGVATDYCILYSVLDALELGFSATVIQDACRAIDLNQGDEEKALSAMKAKGAKIIQSSELDFGTF